MATPNELWTKLISHALHTRLPAPKLSAFALRLAQTNPLPPRQIANLLLRPQSDSGSSVDPLVPLYVANLLQNGELIDTAGVLVALLKFSTLASGRDKRLAEEGKQNIHHSGAGVRWENSYVEDEAILYGIAKAVSGGLRPTGREEASGILKALNEWMKVLGAGQEMMELAEGHENAQETMAIRVAVGAVLVASLENQTVVEILTKGCPKGNTTHVVNLVLSYIELNSIQSFEKPFLNLWELLHRQFYRRLR